MDHLRQHTHIALPVASGVKQFSGAPAGGLQFCSHHSAHCDLACGSRSSSGLVASHGPPPGIAASAAASCCCGAFWRFFCSPPLASSEPSSPTGGGRGGLGGGEGGNSSNGAGLPPLTVTGAIPFMHTQCIWPVWSWPSEHASSPRPPQ